MPLLTADAFKLATSRGHTLFSELDDVSYPETESNIKKVLNNVAYDWIQSIYNYSVLHNLEVMFIYVSKDNTFGVLHSHTKVIPPEGQACDAEIVGLLSHKINGNVAGKIDIPPNSFKCFFVSIAPLTAFARAALKSLTQSQLIQSTSSMEHLPTPMPSRVSLVFVNLPVLLPVPTGMALPISKSIAHGIPAPP
jgi:hypothetical protein